MMKATSRRLPKATPTPVPAFAPALSPVSWSRVFGRGAAVVEAGVEDVLVAVGVLIEVRSVLELLGFLYSVRSSGLGAVNVSLVGVRHVGSYRDVPPQQAH